MYICIYLYATVMKGQCIQDSQATSAELFMNQSLPDDSAYPNVANPDSFINSSPSLTLSFPLSKLRLLGTDEN